MTVLPVIAAFFRPKFFKLGSSVDESAYVLQRQIADDLLSSEAISNGGYSYVYVPPVDIPAVTDFSGTGYTVFSHPTPAYPYEVVVPDVGYYPQGATISIPDIPVSQLPDISPYPLPLFNLPSFWDARPPQTNHFVYGGQLIRYFGPPGDPTELVFWQHTVWNIVGDAAAINPVNNPVYTPAVSVPMTLVVVPANERATHGSFIFSIAPQLYRPLTWQETPAPVPYWMQPYLRFNPSVPAQNQRMAIYDLPSAVPLPPRIKPYEVPYLRPPVQLTTGGVKPLPLPRAHALVRPPAGVKESKVRVPAAIKISQHAYGTVTEALDVLNALYDAVPYRNRPRGRRRPTVEQKIRAIYKSIGASDYDVARALQNIAVDNVGDYLHGQVGKINRKISGDLQPFGGLPIGFQVGSAKWRRLYNKGKGK